MMVSARSACAYEVPYVRCAYSSDDLHYGPCMARLGAIKPVMDDYRVGSGPELDFVRRVRRAIHRRPELGHAERRTASYVERILRQMDLKPFRPAPTSVAVVVGAAGVAPSIGFRADMDAIPVHEAIGAPYTSRNPGVMHACGHDAHTAALLMLARRLTGNPCPAPVLLVFQQAEETYPSGAPLVIEGLPRNLMPREIFACHVWPELPAGVVGARAGTMMASVAGVTIDVHGREGRASGTAAESGGVDAVSAAIRLYGRLEPDTGRQLHDESPTALSIGVIHGGDGPNRVATRCQLQGTLRALSWADQDAAAAAIMAAAGAVADETRAKIEVSITSGIRPPVRNSAGSVARLRAISRSRPRASSTWRCTRPALTAGLKSPRSGTSPTSSPGEATSATAPDPARPGRLITSTGRPWLLRGCGPRSSSTARGKTAQSNCRHHWSLTWARRCWSRESSRIPPARTCPSLCQNCPKPRRAPGGCTGPCVRRPDIELARRPHVRQDVVGGRGADHRRRPP
jgi:amidohydrolase